MAGDTTTPSGSQPAPMEVEASARSRTRAETMLGSLTSVYSMKTMLPFTQWPTEFRNSGDPKGTLVSDMLGGITCGVMLIPQGMAYALIAQLPPVYGLYSSFIPPLVYALLGTSKQLSVGPVALVSLLTAEGLELLADPKTETARYIALASALALLVGVMQVGLGFARFGFVTNFLSHPVISGFTSASALIIGAKQLKYFFGTKASGSTFVLTIESVVNLLGDTDWRDVMLALMTLAVLFGLQIWKRSDWKYHTEAKLIPGALVVVILGLIISEASGDSQINIVGLIPSGLPSGINPWGAGISGADLVELLPTAGLISLIGFVESIAVAQNFAHEAGYTVDSNQELVALGAANLLGSFLQAYPTTGGFSRTAVSAQAGSTTSFNGVFTSLTMLIALLVLTPLFENRLPTAVLGGIVLHAVSGLFKWRDAVHLWHLNRQDAVMLVITFLSTLFIGVETGLGIGVGLSVLLVVHRASYPYVAELGRKPDTELYVDLKHNSDAIVSPQIRIVRFDASLFFANALVLKTTIRDLAESLREQHSAAPVAGGIVLVASGINSVDSTGAEELVKLARELEEDRNASKAPAADDRTSHPEEDVEADGGHVDARHDGDASSGVAFRKGSGSVARERRAHAAHVPVLFRVAEAKKSIRDTLAAAHFLDVGKPHNVFFRSAHSAVLGTQAQLELASSSKALDAV